MAHKQSVMEMRARSLERNQRRAMEREELQELSSQPNAHIMRRNSIESPILQNHVKARVFRDPGKTNFEKTMLWEEMNCYT